ncbi:MAG: pyridoxal-phosphate dependent enzyme [Alcanivoracaceae bacterium]|nr:pyridoxal-phosphate dependent enzyme [Alcanivoracaceae bacterium]
MIKLQINKETITEVYKSIQLDILKTPLIYSRKLSTLSGANVFLKMEHLQLTNSFKIRGVLSKIKSIPRVDYDKVFVAASTGNHAAAFGYAAEKFGYKGILFLPENIEEEKLKGISNYDIEKVLYGNTSMETEKKASQYANSINGILIHPYNDVDIIKGQGTIALEIESQLPQVDTIMAPIGGGGLISGICCYFSGNDRVNVIGCQPVNASEMHDSINEGMINQPSTLKTIADAAAGGIERDSITFDICRKHLSRIELIKEESIKKAVAFLYKNHEITVEPTAALTVATLLKDHRYMNKNIVLILTGNKINQQLLKEIKEEYGNYN